MTRLNLGLISSLVGLIGLTSSCRDFADEVAETTAMAAGNGGEPKEGSGMGHAGAEPSAAGGDRAGSVNGGGGTAGGTPPEGGRDPIDSANGGGGVGDAGAVPSGGGSDSSNGGAAGTAEDGGASEWFGGEEPTLIPQCVTNGIKTVSLTVGLAASVTYDALRIVLYSFDPSDSTAVLRWSDAVDPTQWYNWACFDILPSASRLAAMNLPNGQPEVFALTDAGAVFVRRQATDWTPWLPFSPPNQLSRVSDVAAVGGTLPRVYVADRGRVFVREKVDVSAYSNYGAWQALSSNDARFVSALSVGDGNEQVHEVFALDGEGNLQHSSQRNAEKSFEPWAALPRLEAQAIDLDAAGSEQPEVFVLDAEGNVWKFATTAAEPQWVKEVPASNPRIVSITTRTSGNEIQVFGIDSGGAVHTIVGTTWTP